MADIRLRRNHLSTINIYPINSYIRGQVIFVFRIQRSNIYFFPYFLCYHIAADVGFLNLSTNDELKASADHNLRPIIVPRDLNAMPWYSGYAECINSGKSQYNEDQAGNYRKLFFSMNGQIMLFVVVKCFNGR